MARFDLDRLTEGFRRVAGDRVAGLARQDFGGNDISDDEWAAVFAAFGPRLPSPDVLARRLRNPDVGAAGADRMRALDAVAELRLIDRPTLVCVGDRDPGTPVEASREIVEALPAGVGRLAVLEGVGHFPWLDAPDRYWPVIEEFVATAGRRGDGHTQGL
jgi:pimeloyl-ACP methyl ester carboxylesterase